jgi:hypothetical protein
MIIEVDEYKKKIPSYDASKSEEFHSESAKLADKDFIKYLKTKKYKRIIFMAGGTASGKTEYSTSRFVNKDQLVYDGTLKNLNGFNIKLKHVKKYSTDSKVKVVLIVPNDWIKAFQVFLKRERKMKTETFFETQIKSKETVAKILKETKVRVEIYTSYYEEGKDRLGYRRVKIHNRKKIANSLEMIANSINEIAIKNGFEIYK